MAQEFDAVVVGGGFSGLYAAALLSQKSRRVCVLESGPNLGGRAFSYRDPRTGDEVDNGQHALLGAYAATERLWNPLAIAALNEAPGRASAALFAEVLRRAFLAKASDSVIGISKVPLSQLYVGPAEAFLASRGGSVRLRSRATALLHRAGAV